MMTSDYNLVDASGNGSGYIPAVDFQLFNLPMFSPLQLNEFGVNPYFSANTPTPYVDFSLNQLLSMLRTPNPEPFQSVSYPESFELQNLMRFFQSGTGDLPPSRQQIEADVQRTRKVYEEAKGEYDRIKQIGDAIRGIGRGVYDTATAPAQLPSAAAKATNETVAGAMKPLSEGFKSFIQTYAIAIIAVIAIFFLILFARR